MKENNIETRAIKLSYISALSSLFSVVIQLASVPICLKFWGDEKYGKWIAIYAYFLTFQSIDMGFISFIGNKINILHYQNKILVQRHFSSSLYGVLLIGFIELIICFSIYYIGGSYITWIGLSFEYFLSLVILIINWILFGAFIGIIHRLLIPHNMMYEATWISIAVQLTQFICIIAASILDLDLIETSLLFSCLQSIAYITSAYYVINVLPEYYPWWRESDFKLALKDFIGSVGLISSNAINQISVNLPIILISTFGVIVTIPAFTSVRAIANAFSRIGSILTLPLFPEVVRLQGSNEHQKIILLNKVYLVIIGNAINLGVVIFYPLIDIFYDYWTAHKLILDHSLLSTLLASIVVANTGGFMAMYYGSINKIRINLFSALIRLTAILGLGIFLYLHFGLSGVGMSILIGELIVLLYLFFNFYAFNKIQNNKKSLASNLKIEIFSLSFVMIYLLVEAIISSCSKYIYPFIILGILIFTVIGWKNLNYNIRLRLHKAFTNLLPRATR